MLSKVEPLVRGVHEQRVFRQTTLLQVIQHTANGPVDTGNTAEVVFDVGLEFPLLQGRSLQGVVRRPKLPLVAVGQPTHRIPTGKSCRRHLLHVPTVEVATDFHHVFAGGTTALVIVVEGLWQWEIKVREQVVVHGIWTPIPVRCLELVEKHERLALIASFRQPFQTVVFNDLGGVAGRLDHCVLPIDAKLGMEVGALPPPIDQHFRMVKASRCGAKVPFANDRSLVAVLLEHFGEGVEAPVKITSVHVLVESVDM